MGKHDCGHPVTRLGSRLAASMAAIAAACFALSGQAQAQTPAPEKPKLTIAVGGAATDLDKLTYGIALSKGFFKEEGLDVTNIDMYSGSKALQALAGGSVDAVEGAYEGTLRLQPQGLTLTCMGVFAHYPGVVMMALKGKGSPVHTLADLKGKKIGVTAPGSLTQTFAVALMRGAGLQSTDASYIAVGVGASALAAAQSGEIDVLVNVDPTVEMLRRSGQGRILVDGRIAAGSRQAFGGPYPNGCILAPASFIQKYPRTAQALTNGIVHAMKFLQTASVDEIVKSVPRSYYQDEGVYRDALKNNLELVRWDGLMTPQISQTVLDGISLLDPKFKTAKIDFSKTYNNDLTRHALDKFK
jgi:NitT/TauT family transport system substrate-binding protein